jgi:hypothetical protein
MLNTVGDLITFTLKAANITGVGQTPMAEDSNTALELLRMLLAQWQKKRWLVYVQQEVSVDASTGAQFYTIGPGQDFDCARPAHLAAAYIRIIPGVPPNLVDVPVKILQSREDYAAISVKSLETMPAYVFYDSNWPTGRLYWWPVPPSGMYGLYITVMAALPSYTRLTDALDLPDEYLEALMWSLAVRLQMSYGLPAKAEHVAAMKVAMNTLRQANTQIPELSVPAPGGRFRGDASLVGHGLGRAFVTSQDVVLG